MKRESRSLIGNFFPVVIGSSGEASSEGSRIEKDAAKGTCTKTARGNKTERLFIAGIGNGGEDSVDLTASHSPDFDQTTKR